MYSFQDLYNTYTTITKDTSSTNITNGKLWINDTQKRICQKVKNASFLEDEWYADSVASQEPYRLAHNYGKLIDVWYINGTTKYSPKLVESSQDWTYKSALSTTSDYPDYFHIFGDYIFFYPAFTSNGIDIHMRYRKSIKDMTFDDYTTGTISITTNTNTVTGVGTTFTQYMVGRYIKFTNDENWYEISGFSSTTSITLAKTFEGYTISSGTYKISQIPVIPDGFQDILWQKPAGIYFMIKGEESRANFYLGLYREGLQELITEYSSKTTSQVFTKTEGERKNPNDYPTNIG